MKIHLIKNNDVAVGVTEECGHLFPVQFNVDGEIVEPLNLAPWSNEHLDDSFPPMLKMLRGDFFCAPFGNSDILTEDTRAHGTSANDTWNLIHKDNDNLELRLAKKIMGSVVTKKIKLIPGHPVVYQEHIFAGGEGKIPMGHHLMLKAPGRLFLSFQIFFLVKHRLRRLNPIRSLVIQFCYIHNVFIILQKLN